MKKFLKLGATLCTLMLALMLSSFTTKQAQEEAPLEGVWIEVFYEFNFDAGKVETKTYKFDAFLSNQEKWHIDKTGDNKYHLYMTYFARKSGGFIDDGDSTFDITVVDNRYVTEFNDNYKIVELTEDKLVVECYNDTTLKERKTFKRKN